MAEKTRIKLPVAKSRTDEFLRLIILTIQEARKTINP